MTSCPSSATWKHTTLARLPAALRMRSGRAVTGVQSDPLGQPVGDEHPFLRRTRESREGQHRALQEALFRSLLSKAHAKYCRRCFLPSEARAEAIMRISREKARAQIAIQDR